MSHRHPVNRALHDNRGLGDKATDALASAVGSWRFVLIQNAIVLLWVIFNYVAIFRWHWDPYPFILLNLVFSWQASNTGPVLQMATNRSAEHDRLKAEHDYEINEIALAEIKADKELTSEVRHLVAAVHEVICQTVPAPKPRAHKPARKDTP
jgi:uncharacterized membrane protein